MQRTISIIIPFYTTSLSKEEWFSLDRCFEITGGRHDIVFVIPNHLSIDSLSLRYGNLFRVERFDDHYFESIDGYNELMLSTPFYERFLTSKYILIYQADCYLFTDNLEDWCNLGYDYVGAPWINKTHYTKLWYRLFIKTKKIFVNKHSYEHLKLAVGNGGFSLRKTVKFHALTIELKKEIVLYLNNRGTSIFNEDIFWSIEVNRTKERLRIAPYSIALSFAFDDFPAVAYSLTNEQLPMGCHGWTKERCRDFWRDKIDC